LTLLYFDYRHPSHLFTNPLHELEIKTCIASLSTIL
jgi:hypothetical protein